MEALLSTLSLQICNMQTNYSYSYSKSTLALAMRVQLLQTVFFHIEVKNTSANGISGGVVV